MTGTLPLERINVYIKHIAQYIITCRRPRGSETVAAAVQLTSGGRSGLQIHSMSLTLCLITNHQSLTRYTIKLLLWVGCDNIWMVVVENNRDVGNILTSLDFAFEWQSSESFLGEHLQRSGEEEEQDHETLKIKEAPAPGPA